MKNRKALAAMEKHKEEGSDYPVKLIQYNTPLWQSVNAKGFIPFFTLDTIYGLFDETPELKKCISLYEETRACEKKKEVELVQKENRIKHIQATLKDILACINYSNPKYKSRKSLYNDQYNSIDKINAVYVDYPDLGEPIYYRGTYYYQTPQDEYLIGPLKYGNTIITEYGITRSILNEYFKPFMVVSNPHYSSRDAYLYRMKDVEKVIKTNKELFERMERLKHAREERQQEHNS